MRVKAFNICVLLSLFILRPAYGYITHISVWKNEKTGKWIYLMGDWHNIGTPAANEKQMKFFKEKILEKYFEAHNLETQFLFEDRYSFFNNLNKASFYDKSDKGMYKKIFPDENTLLCTCPVDYGANKIKPHTLEFEGSEGLEQTTWLTEFVRYIGKNTGPYQHVKLKSIDPRIYKLLIEEESLKRSPRLYKIASFAHIFQLGYMIDDIVNYVKSESNPGLLTKELLKIQYEIEKDYETLLKTLNNYSISKEDLSKYPLKVLLRKKLITEDELKRIEHLFNDGYFLSKVLDRIALWESCKENAAQHSFIAAGNMHRENLEKHLEALGFKEKFHSKDGFIVKTEDGQYKLYPDEKDDKTQLPVGLEDEMARSFTFIQELAKDLASKKLSTSSSSSNSLAKAEE